MREALGWAIAGSSSPTAIAWALFVVILALTIVLFRLSNRWVYYEGDTSRR